MFSAYVTVPILILIHELGHARAAIRLGRRPVVVIGKQPALVVKRFRRFDLLLHPRLPLDQFYPRTPLTAVPKECPGECGFEIRGLTVDQLRSVYAAGPHASNAVALLLSAVAFLVADSYSVIFWIAVVGAFSAWATGIGNLIPRQAGGRLFSDGAQIARLRGLRGDFVPVPDLDAGADGRPTPSAG